MKKQLLIISLSILLITPIHGFILTPYREIGRPSSFTAHYRYDTNHLSGESKVSPNVTLMQYGLGFSFKTIAYELTLNPIEREKGSSSQIEADNTTLMSHNLRWQVFKDIEYGIFKLFKPGFQVGILNLGLSSDTQKEDDIFSKFLPGYYYMYEMHFFKNSNLNLYLGENISAEKNKREFIGLIEYKYLTNTLFLEYGYEQWYLGLKTKFSKQITLSGAINLVRSDLENNDKFFPEITLQAEIMNTFSKQKKKKKKYYPLKIDRTTFHYMEKGLLSFYEENYIEAIKYYEKVIRKYPRFGLAHLRLGNAHYQLKNYDIAEQEWRLALKYKINNPNEVLYFLKKMKNEKVGIETMIKGAPEEKETDRKDNDK